MTVKFSNDASTTLTSGITAAATSLSVASAANFPSLSSGEYTYLTLSNVLDTQKEIVKCTAISGTTFTVTRGAESTTAQSFSSGDRVQIRITAGLFGDALDEKVDDSQVQTNVPSGAVFTDTVYSHPSTHPASMLTGALPAIDGSALTNMPAGGATNIDGLSDARSFSSLSSYGLGADALNASMTGGSNTAVGGNTLTAITSGYNNTAVGVSALRLNTTGTDSTGLGQQALYDQTTGHGNTAVGKESLSGVTTGQNNIGIGKKSGEYITTGSNNTVLGDLNGTSTMSSTVLIGAGSTERLKVNSTGLYVNGAELPPMKHTGGSIGIGSSAISSDDGTSNYNTAVGTQAMNYVTTGNRNAALGSLALNNITTGRDNVAVGASSLQTTTVGVYNTALGRTSLNKSTGNSNTAVGYKSLESATTSSSNIAVGKEAGASITTGANNTIIGSLNGTSALSSTVLIGAGTTERLKIDSTGLYVNGSSTALVGGASDIDGLSDAISGDASSYGIGDGALPSDDGSTNSNVAIGQNSMASMVSGSSNVALGGYSLQDNVSGYRSTAIGHYALNNSVVTTAAENVAVGYRTGVSSTTGISNTLLGTEAGAVLTTGSYNIFVGNGAGTSVSTGSNNTIIGRGGFNTSSSLFSTVLIGAGTTERLKIDSTGLYVNGSSTALAGGASDIDGLSDGFNDGRSIGLGDNALANDDGSNNDNTALGWNALSSNTSGDVNTGVGRSALEDVTTGIRHTAVGCNALKNVTTNHCNTALGFEAGQNITTGYNNTVIGRLHGTSGMSSTVLIGAGDTERLKITSSGLFVNGSSTALAGGASDIDGLTDGYNVGNSVGLGTGALANDDGTTNNNTAVGTSALNANTTGAKNIASGYKALYANTTGNFNTATGFEALRANTTASYNTATGGYALYSNTTGNHNTASGYYALRLNTTGYDNVAVGYKSQRKTSTGHGNTTLGFESLEDNTTGYRNIAIGYGSGRSIGTGFSNTIVGGLAGTASMTNTVLLGAGSTERLKVTVDGLTTNGSAGANIDGWLVASGNITAYSDERLKDNIETITSPLDKVLALRGVTFDKDGERGLGVIAQETEAVIPEVVMTHDDEMGTKSVAYGNMVGLLIEAIKEQQTQIDELKAQLGGA